MKIAGVVIDDWKLPIFKKHLDKAGYKCIERLGPSKGVLTLMVEYEWVNGLKPIIEAADEECKKVKRN